ncbi:MAG: winged-helix domain-containing protein [Anaerolineae bacterium]|nr:winged-helix domain-containing protein [Anaerolineae bacterium]
MGVQLLLIERENLVQSKSLHVVLENQGYRVTTVHTFENAAEKTNANWPNLILFHANSAPEQVPKFQTFLSNLTLKVPVIVVANESTFSQGDVAILDVEQLPSLPKEIESAISDQEGRFIRLPGLIIDCHQRRVRRENDEHLLTPKELKLLRLLISNNEQVMSRKDIMRAVWDTDYMGDTRTLDVHIRWIREKIEENPSRPQRLITMRGRGYRFIKDPK